MPPLDDAIESAFKARPDFQSQMSQVQSAELVRKASSAERYPSIEQVADYGITGVNPASTHGTVDAAVTLRVPIFQGGKVHADVLRADASLQRAKQVLEDMRAQIDQEVRDAYLDLESAAQEVSVEKTTVKLATETLRQSRDRFSSGVTDNIEVVQAQDALATANDAYIASLYSYNLAKISLARAIGRCGVPLCAVLERRPERRMSMAEQNQASNTPQATPPCKKRRLRRDSAAAAPPIPAYPPGARTSV